MPTKTVDKPNARNGRESMQTETIVLPEINVKTFWLTIIGDSALLQHKFSAKIAREIEQRQQDKAIATKKARNPEEEYEEATHRDESGAVCVPSVALKKAAIEALSSLNKGKGRSSSGVTKVLARMVFHISPDGQPDLVRIGYVKRVMDSRPVRLPNGSADIRYRPRYDKWWAHFPIRFDVDSISQAQIMNMFMKAGFGVGIGDNRPGKAGGDCGQFHLADSAEVDALIKLEASKNGCEQKSLLSERVGE